MRLLKWAPILVFCALLYGCTNTTPAMKGVTTLTNVAANALDTVKALADQLKDPAAKAAIHAKADAEMRKALELHKKLTELLEQYGEIDYREFVEIAFELYRKYEGLKK